MKSQFIFLVALALAAPGGPQKYSVADLADFTKSPTEHVIDQVDEPFFVRSVNGLVGIKNGQWEPLAGVLFEIEGPGAERRIHRARTDRQGRFKVGPVSAGTYKFKATLDGFRSVVGTIVISKKAEKGKNVKIGMRFGV